MSLREADKLARVLAEGAGEQGQRLVSGIERLIAKWDTENREMLQRLRAELDARKTLKAKLDREFETILQSSLKRWTMYNSDKAARILASDSGEIMMRMADTVLNTANMSPAERLEIENLRKLTIKEILSPELDQRAQSMVILVLEFAIDKAKQGISP